MRAAILNGTGALEFTDLEVPKLGDHDVKIAVSLNGLCGTDITEYAKGQRMVPLNYLHPTSGHTGPTVLGHEFIGTVVETGAAVPELLGTRVACGAGISCGECDRCREGRTNLCVRYFTLGLSTHGGLAEFVVTPANTCAVIPADVPDREAVLAQPLAVGIHAVRRAGVRSGDRVAILGVGAIGSFISAGLLGHDAEVTAFDVDEHRLELSRTLGVTHTQLISGADSLDGLDGFDVVFECTGVNGMAQGAYRITRNGGTTVLVGLSKDAQLIDVTDIVLREVNTVTTVAHVCASDLSEALDLLRSFPLADLLVDRVISLDELVDGGMQRLANGEFGGKVIVDCQSSAAFSM